MADISIMMKDYLTTHSQINSILTSLKGLRKELRDQGEQVKSAMIEASLSVVRILQHPSGSHDILLNERITKKTISPSRIKEVLHRDFADRRLDPESIEEVVAAFEIAQDPVKKQHIKVKKLKEQPEIV